VRLGRLRATDIAVGTCAGRYRLLLRARQRESEVRNLVAEHAEDLTPLLGRLATSSRNFH